jgi:hypothetical protein
MKKLFAFGLTILLAISFVFAQTGTIGPTGATGPTGVTGANGKLPDCYTCKQAMTFAQKTIVMLPVILTALVFAYVFLRLWKEDYKIGDALKESNVEEVPNPKYDPAKPAGDGNQPTIKDLPKSSSRLIALLSGSAAVCIAVSSCSYYFYIFLKTGTAPDLSKMYDILLGLGIGVTPYAFNKVSSVFSK